jgi:serine/threonine protein kinase
VNDRGHALIADFGSSRHSTVNVTPTSSRDPAYSALELGRKIDWRREVGWTEKVDVYSFGVILKEILTGPRFHENRPGFNVSMGHGVLRPIEVLINSCQATKPDDRPSFETILTVFEVLDFAIVTGGEKPEIRGYRQGFREWDTPARCNSLYFGQDDGLHRRPRLGEEC